MEVGQSVRWMITPKDLSIKNNAVGIVIASNEETVEVKWDVDIITTCKLKQDRQSDLHFLDVSKCGKLCFYLSCFCY